MCLRWDALHHASQKCKTTVVRYLLDIGANVDATTNKQLTPLILATLHGHMEIVQLLVDNMATVAKKNAEGFALFHKFSCIWLAWSQVSIQ